MQVWWIDWPRLSLFTYHSQSFTPPCNITSSWCFPFKGLYRQWTKQVSQTRLFNYNSDNLYMFQNMLMPSCSLSGRRPATHRCPSVTLLKPHPHLSPCSLTILTKQQPLTSYWLGISGTKFESMIHATLLRVCLSYLGHSAWRQWNPNFLPQPSPAPPSQLTVSNVPHPPETLLS